MCLKLAPQPTAEGSWGRSWSGHLGGMKLTSLFLMARSACCLQQARTTYLPRGGTHPHLRGPPTSITSQGTAPPDLSLQASLMEVFS